MAFIKYQAMLNEDGTYTTECKITGIDSDEAAELFGRAMKDAIKKSCENEEEALEVMAGAISSFMIGLSSTENVQI